MSDDTPLPEQAEPTDPRRARGEPEGLLLVEPCPEDHPSVGPARFLLERWRAARAGDPGRLPSREAFSPESLGRLLGRVSLLEPLAGGRDFRFRVHAGIAADVGGIDLAGKRVGEMPYPDYSRAIIRAFATAIETEAPQIQRLRLNWFGTVYDYTDVVLPLLDEARETQAVLSIMLHYDVDRPAYVSRYRPASVDPARDTLDDE